MKRAAPLGLLLCLLLASCSSGGFTGLTGAASEKPRGDDKPSDQSEGVPGYLVDPGQIAPVTAGGAVRIDAPPGSVAAGVDPLEHLQVVVWSIARTAFDDLLQSPGSASASNLTTVTVADDGSFSTTVATPSAGKLLVLSVARQGDAVTGLHVPSTGDRYAVAYADPSVTGPFLGAARVSSGDALGVASLVGDWDASLPCLDGLGGVSSAAPVPAHVTQDGARFNVVLAKDSTCLVTVPSGTLVYYGTRSGNDIQAETISVTAAGVLAVNAYYPIDGTLSGDTLTFSDGGTLTKRK